MRAASARYSVVRRNSRTIRTSATTCCFTSISTATTEPASAPATRPAGRRWPPNSSSKAGNEFGYAGKNSLTEPTLQQRRRSVLLVFCCTLLGAAAQVLIKTDAGSLRIDTPVTLIVSLLHSGMLLAGFTLYGGSTVLLVLALRRQHSDLL